MPIVLPKVNETIEVPLRIDSALDMSSEEFDKYLETCDPSLLKYKGDERPTLFVMRKVLPWRLSQKVEDMKLGMEHGEAKPRMAWIAEEVRVALCGIKNPEGVPLDQQIQFKQGSDQGASEELLSQLKAIDGGSCVMDLWKARQAVAPTKAVSQKK